MSIPPLSQSLTCLFIFTNSPSRLVKFVQFLGEITLSIKYKFRIQSEPKD